jgi:hypothetical protein
MSYELLQTDFKDTDLVALLFLEAYLPSNNGETRQKLEIFKSAVLIVLALQKIDYKSVTQDIVINDSTNFKAFLDDNSGFSQLIESVQNTIDHSAFSLADDVKPREYAANYIATMPVDNFNNFESDIQVARQQNIRGIDNEPIDVRLVKEFLERPQPTNPTVYQEDEYVRLRKIAESAAALGDLEAFKKVCNVTFTKDNEQIQYLGKLVDQQFFIETAIVCNTKEIIHDLLRQGVLLTSEQYFVYAEYNGCANQMSSVRSNFEDLNEQQQVDFLRAFEVAVKTDTLEQDSPEILQRIKEWK